MLIKIQTSHHADNYLLIDRVDSVKYEGNPKEFTSLESLFDYVGTMAQVESCRMVLDPRGIDNVNCMAPKTPDCTHLAELQTFIGPLGVNRVYRLNTIVYERGGEMKSVLFDTIAYICTDEGKTLERALAGGVLNY